jgi:O-antigen/teichoic acid export membrane protein
MLKRFQKFINSERLLARCARGGAALAAGTFVERGARFARNMILARILAPEQFGIMAIVMAANQLFEALTEVGVIQAIIQNKKGDTEEFLNVAWWFSAVRGIGLYLIGFLAAPFVASFYDEPLLTSLLRVAFLAMLFSGLTSPRLYVLQKHLKFGKYVWIMQGSGLAGTVLTLVAAIYVRNVWALVFGLVAEVVIRCLMSFILCPIRPRFTFDKESSRDLFRFSKGMVGLPILTFVVMQADIFVLGKVCSKDLLGMYSMALALANIPVMVFSRVAGPLILPVFSGLQNDLARLGETLLKTTRLVWLFGLPLAVCLTVFSKPILTVVYGSPYAAAAPAYGLLCFYVVLYMTSIMIASVYMSIGRPEVHRTFTIVRALLVAMGIYPAARWLGPSGAAGTLLICLLLAMVIQVFNLGRVIDLSPRRYWGTLTEGLLMAGAILIPALGFRVFWNGSPVKQVLAGGLLCAGIWLITFWRMRTKFQAGKSEPIQATMEGI